MGRGQELLNAAREGDKRTVERILGQITNISGPFTRWVLFHVLLFNWFNTEVCYIINTLGYTIGLVLSVTSVENCLNMLSQHQQWCIVITGFYNVYVLIAD